jgi:hypothetical protein
MQKQIYLGVIFVALYALQAYAESNSTILNTIGKFLTLNFVGK